MLFKQQPYLLFFLLGLLLFTNQVASAQTKAPEGIWSTVIAYKTDWAYNEPTFPYLPHFGAFFIGGWGKNQHYLGPGGDTATCDSGSGCISVWNWWGPSYSTLLIPKWWWGSAWQHRFSPYYQATVYTN